MAKYSPNYPYRQNEPEKQSERERMAQVKALEEKMWAIFRNPLINRKSIAQYNAYEKRWIDLMGHL